ncbi:MAG: MerR family transcriptional regulator [Lachnospiraceae bacterium]|nr:MerR family transcriptional regulator [Lachnospiraceae bacterium]
MTIKEVCEKYHISQDTLRYYERVGVIPAVHRTKNNIRDYTEQDIACVENAICMRNAGVPVEMVVEYMKLCQQGDETFLARRDLLREVRDGIVKQIEKCQRELERLEYKIERYETAVETGELVWDRTFSLEPETEIAVCEENISEEKI